MNIAKMDNMNGIAVLRHNKRGKIMEIPIGNFNQKIETNNGTAIISIPENARVDDLLYVKEMRDVIIKRQYHIELN